MKRVRLAVVFHDDAWRLQVGDGFSRPFNSDREAIQAAIRLLTTSGGKVTRRKS
jgi:hypothetical protein